MTQSRKDYDENGRLGNAMRLRCARNPNVGYKLGNYKVRSGRFYVNDVEY
jgi:hypothetical protein